jgi:hypothetical protein
VIRKREGEPVPCQGFRFGDAGTRYDCAVQRQRNPRSPSGYHSSVFAGNRLIRFILATTPWGLRFAILLVHSKQIRPAPSHTTIVQSPCLRILLRFTLSFRSSWNTSETNLRPSAGIFLHPRSARQCLSLNAYLTWACRGVNHLLPPSITPPMSSPSTQPTFPTVFPDYSAL